MGKRKGKSATLPFVTPPGWTTGKQDLPPDEQQLLARLVAAVFETRLSQMGEEKFRVLHPQLYFDLRAKYGSFGAALGRALKFEVGERLSRDDVLARVKKAWDSGAPVTLERFVLENPRFARSLLIEFGSLGKALSELGLDEKTAFEDRRWTKERVFRSVLTLGGGSPAQLSEEELTKRDRVLSEVVRTVFPSFPVFRKELREWLARQPGLFVTWGRQVVTRLLPERVAVGSRGGRGRTVLGPGRLRNCVFTAPGEQLFCLSTAGMLYRVQGVPFVSGGASDAKEGLRLSFLGRGERVAALLHWSGMDGGIALVTAAGRVKVMDLSLIRRVSAGGLIVARLAGGDRVVAATVVSTQTEKLVVVTRKGWGVAIDRKSLPPASRHARGKLRLRLERDDEPVAIVGLDPDDDLVILGKNGRLLRLSGRALRVYKGRAKGRRLSAVPVVAACGVRQGSGIIVASRKGRMLTFREEDVRRRKGVRCLGVKAVQLDPDDVVEELEVFSLEGR